MGRTTLVDCNCCGRGYTRDEFDKLEYVGTNHIPGGELDDDKWDEYDLELRNCPCGSTIAVEHPVIKFIEPDPNSDFAKYSRHIGELQKQVYCNMMQTDVEALIKG